MSKVVPEGWTYDELGKYISESVAGEWGTEAVGDENDIPVIRSTNFTSSGVIDYSNLAYRNIDERKRLAKSLKSGDMVLEKSGGSPTQPVGRVVYFDKNEPFLFSNFTQKLTPKPDCDSKFLFYKFYSEYQNGTVLKFQQQTTGIINFQLAEYLRFKSIFPPLSEQQKIATILSSVDNVIEKTRTQIDKLKDLKTGMMQELLTKGIGHTEFKDSPVGRIPKDWKITTLGKSLELIDSGWSPNCIENPPMSGEWGVLKVSSVTRDEFLENESKTLPNDLLPKISAQVHAGDVLLTRANGVAELVGKCVMVRKEPQARLMMSDKILRLKPSCELHNEFLLHVFNSEIIRKQIEMSWGGSSGQKNISQTDIRSYLIPLPPVKEQHAIAFSITQVEKVIFNKNKNLMVLADSKVALMQDLLSGKVRVGL